MCFNLDILCGYYYAFLKKIYHTGTPKTLNFHTHNNTTTWFYDTVRNTLEYFLLWNKVYYAKFKRLTLVFKKIYIKFDTFSS